MRVLVLCEKLDINLTSAGVGRSKLIYSLSLIENLKMDVLYDQWEESDVSALADLDFIRLSKTKNRYSRLKKFNKLGAVYNYISGANFQMSEVVQFWTDSITMQLRSNKYDLIYVLSAGQQFYTFFALLKLIPYCNVPYVLNIHDPYPSSIHPEFKQKMGWIEKLRFNKILKVISGAYRVTLPSKKLGKYLEQFYPINGKWVTIPHGGLHLPYYSLEPRLSSPSSVLRLTHTGLLLSSRNPKHFLKALKQFIKSKPESLDQIRVTFIGPYTIEDEETLVLFDELNPVVSFSKERIPYDQSMNLIKESDVLLLFDFDGKSSPIMLGKLGDYLFFNKPILALTPQDSETTRILGENYPLRTEVNNTEEIYQKLALIYSAWLNSSLSEFDLSEQQNYVSKENLASIFKENILAPLLTQ